MQPDFQIRTRMRRGRLEKVPVPNKVVKAFQRAMSTSECPSGVEHPQGVWDICIQLTNSRRVCWVATYMGELWVCYMSPICVRDFTSRPSF